MRNKTSKILTYLVLITISIIAIIANIYVLKIPVFADGTQHVWITDFTFKNGQLPKEDITGIQPSNFSIPVSIKEPQPFLYPPLFYILSASLSSLNKDPKISVEILNIVPIFITGLFLFLLAREIFNLKVALFVYCLAVLSNIWPWITVHRLVEPIIISMSTALIYCTYKFFKGDIKYLFIGALLVACLFGIKQSTFPLIGAFFISIIIGKKIKHLIISFLLFVSLILPVFIYSLASSHTIFPNPIGVKVIDNAFYNAWWNQKQQTWEDNLDADARTKELRRYTFNQFKQLQLSPSNLYKGYGFIGVLNTFSLYPLSEIGTQGYSSIASQHLTPFFVFLLVCSLLLTFKVKSTDKNQIKFVGFIAALIIILVVFWAKQPVFRYYMYILFLSPILYAYVFNFLIKKSNKFLQLLLVVIICFLTVINLCYELDRDSDYKFTAMHKRLPLNNGGLSDSINFGKKIEKDNSSFVFTPMVEISFYSKKRLLWDNRLFFVDDKIRLLDYLKHYNFKYVVLPFYSGTTTKKDWNFDRGIPRDSTFAKLLNNEDYFQLVESNHTFKAYRQVEAK